MSKIGDFASYGSDPRRIESGANTDGLSVDYKAKYAAQQQVIRDNYKFFDMPYNVTDNDNYADGEGFCCNDGSMEGGAVGVRVDTSPENEAEGRGMERLERRVLDFRVWTGGLRRGKCTGRCAVEGGAVGVRVDTSRREARSGRT